MLQDTLAKMAGKIMAARRPQQGLYSRVHGQSGICETNEYTIGVKPFGYAA
jgi:hypothetical protein